jgi:hypothetical protein
MLGLVGLALMLAGYQLVNYAPPARDIEQERKLEVLRSQAADDPGLSERLRHVGRSGDRPYRAAGTIAIYGGLLLFIAAGIKMYHHRPAPDPTEHEGPEEERN